MIGMGIAALGLVLIAWAFLWLIFEDHIWPSGRG